MTELDNLITWLKGYCRPVEISSSTDMIQRALNTIKTMYPEAINTDGRIRLELLNVIADVEHCQQVIQLFVNNGFNLSLGCRTSETCTAYPCLVAAQYDRPHSLKRLHELGADFTVTSSENSNDGVFMYATRMREGSPYKTRSAECALYLLRRTNVVTEADLLEYLTATHPAFLETDLQEVKAAIVDYIERHPEMGAKVKLFAYLNLGRAGLERAKAVFHRCSNALTEADLLEYLIATQFSLHPAFTKTDLQEVKTAIVDYIERHPEMGAKVKLFAYLNLGRAGLERAKAVFHRSSDGSAYTFTLNELEEIRDHAILLLGDKKPEVRAFLRVLKTHIQAELEEDDGVLAATSALSLNGAHVPRPSRQRRRF